MKKTLFPLLIFLAKTVFPQLIPEKEFTTFHLQTIDHQTFSFDKIKTNNASVLVFLLPDCPACKSYSRTLNQLSDQFKRNNISFIGIFPGHYNSYEEMKEFQNRYQIHFPLLADPDMMLAKSIGARVVPEVFVLSSSGQIVYRGRIDDWLYAIGKKRPVITTHELQEALTAIVKHQPVKIKTTSAIGCIIEY